MLKEGRPGLTEEQKVDMWRKWKAGYSIREICQTLKRNSSPVYQQLAIRGGIAPSGRIRAVGFPRFPGHLPKASPQSFRTPLGSRIQLSSAADVDCRTVRCNRTRRLWPHRVYGTACG